MYIQVQDNFDLSVHDLEIFQGQGTTRSYEYTGIYELQLEIEDVVSQLIEDVELRTEYAKEKIQALVEHIVYDIFANFDQYALNDKYLSSEIPDWKDGTGYVLSSVIQGEIDKIDFFNMDEYA